ncbi:MAG: phosphoglycerate kinase [Candidatus Micrarchaeia archaeon]|jgi:phosphoglycerate kinase
MVSLIGFKTMDDFDFNGKTVLVRVDLNCPVEGGKIVSSERVAAHAKTVKELANKGARVVVLAHQGRAGGEDFLTLEQHAEALARAAKKKVKFVADVIGPEALKRIQRLPAGKILLLDNVRLLAEETLEKSAEEHAKSVMVQRLAPLVDVFVNDAYSASHRSHCSVVGFAAVKPSCAGRVMQRECEENARAAERAEHPNVYVLGGAKPDDVVKLLKRAAESSDVDSVLLGGVVGELALMAKGNNLGAVTKNFLEEKGWLKALPEVRAALEKGGGKMVLPVDLAFEEGGQRVEVDVGAPLNGVAGDVGSKTAKKFAGIVMAAKSVYVKGPLGRFEVEVLSLGTRKVFEAVARCKGFSLVGGGHTLEAFKRVGVNEKRISHVSLAGGALLSYLAGEKLPGVEALKAAAGR